MRIGQEIGGVEETALWTLYHRASEAARADGILDDPKAVEILDSIDYPFRRRFGPPIRTFAIRALAFDREVESFLRSSRRPQVVCLGEGMETQRFRVDDGTVDWLTVDLPDGIRLRENFITPDQRHRHLICSATDEAWTDAVDRNRPVFIAAQGLLMYLNEDDVRRVMQLVARRLPGAWMFFDAVPAWVTGWTQLGIPAARRYVAPKMKWSFTGLQQAKLRRWVPSLAEITTLEYEYPHGIRRFAIAAAHRSALLRPQLPSLCRLRFAPQTRADAIRPAL